MDAEGLLKALQSQGYTLAVEGEQLRLAPASRLSPELRAEVRAHKAALLALVSHAKLSGSVTPDSEAVATERESDATPVDTRPVWIHYANGYPEKVYTVDRIPPEAIYWCREGDSAWKPLPRSERGPRRPDAE